jgi:hypothetical protein
MTLLCVDASAITSTPTRSIQRVAGSGMATRVSSKTWAEPLRPVTELDLSGTAISWRALSLVDFLPALVAFNVEGTAVGLRPRMRLRKTLRQSRRNTANPILHAAKRLASEATRRFSA